MADTENTDGFSLHHWLALLLADKIPRHEILDLLRRHGSPGDVLSEARLGLLSSLPAARIRERIRQCLDWSRKEGNHAICLGGEGYPCSLLESQEPPVMLLAAGESDLLGSCKVLVIGEDDATPAGMENAEVLCRALAANGICIATGLRRGVESAVRRALLDSRSGSIALYGSVFEPNGKPLECRPHAEGGLVLFGGAYSERRRGVESAAYRIGAGIAEACIVIEATLKSNVLAMAQSALESGKEVFAMPGSINSPNYRGCHRLIRDGAHLIENHEDVLAVLRGVRK